MPLGKSRKEREIEEEITLDEAQWKLKNAQREWRQTNDEGMRNLFQNRIDYYERLIHYLLTGRKTFAFGEWMRASGRTMFM
jgi:hypothetical protein